MYYVIDSIVKFQGFKIFGCEFGKWFFILSQKKSPMKKYWNLDFPSRFLFLLDLLFFLVHRRCRLSSNLRTVSKRPNFSPKHEIVIQKPLSKDRGFSAFKWTYTWSVKELTFMYYIRYVVYVYRYFSASVEREIYLCMTGVYTRSLAVFHTGLSV